MGSFQRTASIHLILARHTDLSLFYTTLERRTTLARQVRVPSTISLRLGGPEMCRTIKNTEKI